MKKRKKEPGINGLFTVVVAVYILVSLGLNGLAAAGVELRLPVVLALTLGELTMAIPMLVYLVIRRPKSAQISERWTLPVAVVPLLVLMVYCTLPLVALVNLASMLIAGENAAASLLGVTQQLPLWVSLLCISVLPGVVEETIFRGLLYGEYRRRRTWGAIFLSALLFGLMHMNLNQLSYAFVIGVLFCLVYEATGSLTASMLMHAVYNGNSVVMMYLTDSGAMTEAASMDASAMLEQLLGSEAGNIQLLLMFVVIAVMALVGLAAAGGLYVAVVKLCHREKHVLLLFQRDSMKKRWELAEKKTELRVGTEEECVVKTEKRWEDVQGSRRLTGPILWIGMLLATGMILYGLFVF